MTARVDATSCGLRRSQCACHARADTSKRIPVTIKGWRSGWFKKSDPVVLGEGVLAGPGPLAPIVVKAADEGKGAFTFYFSAVPEAK